jgi:DNA modification methylase
MRTIKRDELKISDRQRAEIDPLKLSELKDSISARGLLHPPVVRHVGQSEYALVAGERRVRAIDALWTEGQIIRHDSGLCPPGELPVVLADLSNASEWMSAEFEENVVRADLPWADRCRAIAAIHEQRKLDSPDTTIIETAKALVEKGVSESVGHLRGEVREATVVAAHLSKYKIKTARSMHEAFQIIMQDEGKRWEAMLVERQLKLAPSKEDIEVRLGDMEILLPILDGDRFDLLLADPPYGINADSGGFRARSQHHHVYEDDPKLARNLLQIILTEGFRICKQRANIFLFTDQQHFDWLLSAASAAGWVPWRRPIIWQKSKSEGLAPWGRSGFRHVYEIIFYATKGQRGLIHSPIDILEARRVSRADRMHGAQKPVDLMKQLIECSTMIGEAVLDPCCGSGSTLQAMRQLKRKGLGIELNQEYYNIALTRAHKDDEEDADAQQGAA